MLVGGRSCAPDRRGVSDILLVNGARPNALLSPCIWLCTSKTHCISWFSCFQKLFLSTRPFLFVFFFYELTSWVPRWVPLAAPVRCKHPVRFLPMLLVDYVNCRLWRWFYTQGYGDFIIVKNYIILLFSGRFFYWRGVSWSFYLFFTFLWWTSPKNSFFFVIRVVHVVHEG